MATNTSSPSPLYRLDLKIGTKWVPATAEPMTEHRLDKLRAAYAIDRPHIETRVVPLKANGKRTSERRRK